MAIDFKQNSPKAIIFLGPTLSLAEARQHLPSALYLPPARCGDVLLALRLKPTVIAIIDGFFEHTAAVWHKEILYALEKDVTVFGASSMGALRAAELSAFGMIGIGKIFHDYHYEFMTDDDEVAVLHLPAEHNYAAVTDAMVNIRATLAMAREKAIISAETQGRILEKAKQCNYRDRSLKKSIALADINVNESAALTSWLKDNGIVDQKKLDAIELLNTIQSAQITDTRKSVNVHRSVFLRSLHHQMMSSPFSSQQPGLPETEKLAYSAQKFPEFPQIQQLSRMLDLVYQLAVNEAQSSSDHFCDDIHCRQVFSHIEVSLKSFNEMSDVSKIEIRDFLSRIATINHYIAHKSKQLNITAVPEKYQYWLAGIMTKEHSTSNEEELSKSTLTLNLLKYLALFWWLFEVRANELQLELTSGQLQQASDEFRQRNHLFTQDSVKVWLEEQEFTLSDYQGFITASTRLNVLLNNFAFLGIDYNHSDTFWLLDALWLIGYCGKY